MRSSATCAVSARSRILAAAVEMPVPRRKRERSSKAVGLLPVLKGSRLPRHCRIPATKQELLSTRGHTRAASPGGALGTTRIASECGWVLSV